MSAEFPTNTPEKHETLSDNDRKFIVGTIDQEFLAEHSAISYDLITDWLETNKDNETKLARKKFIDKDDQLLYIAKITVDDERKTKKTKLSETEYTKLLKHDVQHVEKTRYEFKFSQNGIEFTAKYDEFNDSTLRILEIDANTTDERNQFDPTIFPYTLDEVSDDKNYSGFRIIGILETLKSNTETKS